MTASTAELMRAYRGPALFSFGFRPFFLFGAVTAAGLPVFAALSMSGFAAPGGAYGAIAWHGHEMVYGFLAAIVAGFVLTAVPNWTGRLPVLGARLMSLFALWLSGRAAIAASGVIGAGAAAIIDSSFLIVLDLIIFREITAGKNWRNMPVCLLLALFATGNVVWHMRAVNDGADPFGLRWGLAVIAMLIALIGGRITPSFTRNWFLKNGIDVPASPFSFVDKAALGALGAGLILWLVAPTGLPTGAVLAAASALHLLRFARWRGWRTISEPMVTILHIGYLWLAVSIGFLAASALQPAVIATSTAFHALTAGGAGVMTLAVMTRATRGHTGRALTADGATIAIYALVNLGAALRVAAAFFPSSYAMLLIAASIAWSGAFLLFAIVYGRYLAGPRA
ncbi:MAG TPA: NnrS family protein [Parvularculaceae bacterium]|nr:NnrS family protein [Parvularculaceae bacterium]